MGKKIIWFLIAVLVVILALLGYFLRQDRTNLLTDPWKAIPADAAVVIETADLQSFIGSISSSKGIFGEIAKVKEFGDFNAKIPLRPARQAWL